MQRALQAKFNGEIEKALALMDQAISKKEKAGLNPAQAKFQRELILFNSSPTKDFSGLISVSQSGLEQFKHEGNIVEQIDLLITLAGLCLHAARKKEALDYPDRAEKLLSISTPEGISQYLYSPQVGAGEINVSSQMEELDQGELAENDTRLILLSQGKGSSLSAKAYLELRQNEVNRLIEHISSL